MTMLTRRSRSARPTLRRDPRPSYLVVLVVAAVLAAASLAVLPDGVAYDPWSWLIWGRELLHGSLSTQHAATSMKPLPVYVDAGLSVFGGAAPTLWLLVSRFAALAGVGIAFRLADRLGGPVAGGLAALAVATSDQYASYLFFTGMSEPMALATTLAAVDLHVSGRHRRTFLLILVTALLRLEAWPFAAGYALWRLWQDPAPRRIAIALAGLAALPLAWFGTDWLGSHQLLRSASASSQESQGGPLLSSVPGWATVTQTRHLLIAPVAVAALLTFVIAIVGWRRSPLCRRLGCLGLAALGWLAVTASMAQVRIATGSIRYLLPAAGLAAVIGGVGIAKLVDAIRPRVGALGAGFVVVAAVAACLPQAITVGDRVRDEQGLGAQLSTLSKGLARAVSLGGGEAGLHDCGHVATAAFQVPPLVWQAGLRFLDVDQTVASKGTVVQMDGRPAIPPQLLPAYQRVGVAGPPGERWTVSSTCH